MRLVSQNKATDWSALQTANTTPVIKKANVFEARWGIYGDDTPPHPWLDNLIAVQDSGYYNNLHVSSHRIPAQIQVWTIFIIWQCGKHALQESRIWIGSARSWPSPKHSDPPYEQRGYQGWSVWWGRSERKLFAAIEGTSEGQRASRCDWRVAARGRCLIYVLGYKVQGLSVYTWAVHFLLYWLLKAPPPPPPPSPSQTQLVSSVIIFEWLESRRCLSFHGKRDLTWVLGKASLCQETILMRAAV